METKLKSILNRIPWWLACKAGFLAVLWLLFPFWVFFLAANYFYWIPFFEAGAFLVPFFLTLILAVFAEPGAWGTLGVGTLFFLMLGAKELSFVRRGRVYEILSVGLLFFGVLEIAFSIQNRHQIEMPFLFFLAGIAFFCLRESAFRYAVRHREEESLVGGFPTVSRSQRFTESALTALLFWEYGTVIGGMPLLPLAKSAVLFAGAAAFFLLTPFEGTRVAPERLGRYLGALIAVVFLVFITSSWTL